jgi:hypothetical protein
METLSLDLEQLEALIKEEIEKYNRAIANNVELEEAKAIYLKIKLLGEKAEQLIAHT